MIVTVKVSAIRGKKRKVLTEAAFPLETTETGIVADCEDFRLYHIACHCLRRYLG